MITARGWDRQSAAVLFVAVLAAYALGQVSVELRTGTDYLVSVDVIDRLVLLGLAVPIAVIVRQLEDRAAWLFATGSRNRHQDRACYLAVLVIGTLLVGAGLAYAYSTPGYAPLVFADIVLLLGLGIASAVLLGAQLAWIAPMAVALVCSTPGLVPIEANLLVRLDRASGVLAAGSVLLGVSMSLFVLFDDYGLSRGRLLSRQSGVTDD